MEGYDEKFDKIRDIVSSMAMSNYKSFYPEYIKKSMPELSLEDIICKLEPLRKEGAIVLRFEIRCTDDFTVLDVVDNYTDVIGTEIYCRECEKDIYISEENIYPKYFINDQYCKYLKKKLKTEQLLAHN